MRPVRRHTALVADDEKSIRQLLEVVLGRDFEVTSVSDGREAALYLKEATPDLIVLDINMPEISGLELCSRLRRTKRFEHTPIVILTGDQAQRSRDEAKLYRASLFVQKPLVGRTFLENMRTLVEAKKDSPQS
jgi:PleD family two-component response regulator